MTTTTATTTTKTTSTSTTATTTQTTVSTRYDPLTSTTIVATTSTSSSNETGGCGGVFTAKSGTFSSPLYPSSYPANATCAYAIDQPAGTYVRLTLLSIDIAPYNTSVHGPWTWNEDFDTVDGVHCDLHEILDIREFLPQHYNSYALMARLCGNESDLSLPMTFTSTENFVLIGFISDDIGRNGQGFLMKYERLNCSSESDNNTTCGSGCGGNFTAESGFLTSPYYPGSYTDMTVCTYFISVPQNMTVSYTFTFMDLEGSMPTGCLDTVYIFDGNLTESDYVGYVCGTQPLGPMVSTQNSIWLRYSDSLHYLYSNVIASSSLIYQIPVRRNDFTWRISARIHRCGSR